MTRAVNAIGSGLLLLLALCCPAFASDEMLLSEALTTVRAVEAAARAGDPARVAEFMSPDCVIQSSAPKMDGSTRVTTRGPQQYVQDELAAGRKATGHVYASSEPEIAIVDGKAVARFTTNESATMDGRYVQATANQSQVLEWRNGRVLITRVESVTTSMTIDGQRIY